MTIKSRWVITRTSMRAQTQFTSIEWRLRRAWPCRTKQTLEKHFVQTCVLISLFFAGEYIALSWATKPGNQMVRNPLSDPM